MQVGSPSTLHEKREFAAGYGNCVIMSDQFDEASTYLNTHNVPLSNDQKLKVYGLYKQATAGDCNTSRPSLFEFVGRAKWDAWDAVQGMSVDDAKLAYVELVESFQVGWSRQGEYQQEDKKSDIPNDQEQSGKSVAVSLMAYDGPTEDTGDIFGRARQNDIYGVHSRVTKHNDPVDSKDEDGLTALHYASDRGHVEMVKLLLELGADVNAKTSEEETPLHYACISEQLDVAQLLLKHGCDETIRDASGETAFEQADSSFLQQLGRTAA